MPKFDGTGPLGFGPGSGRGMGPCGAGMGWRRSRAFARFWGYGSYQPQITKREEVEILTDQAEMLERELETIKDRLAELKVKK
jgi:hypothetical protein